MSKLTTLRDKDPKEVARLLSRVSSSLLPNPGVDEVIEETGKDKDFVQAVLTEIKGQLKVQEGDYSPAAQSRIFRFLSDEISRAALANVDIEKVKDRLGHKGELPPHQYKVIFDKTFLINEALGNRKAQIEEAVAHPDRVATILPRYVSDTGVSPHIISTKSISTKRSEDSFTWIILGIRKQQTHHVLAAFRAYHYDVDISNTIEPIDMVKAFVTAYGLTFRFDGRLFSLINNELTSRVGSGVESVYSMKPLYAKHGTSYLALYHAQQTRLIGNDGIQLDEIIMGFVINIDMYAATLRKHHVKVAPESEWKFPRV